MAFVNWAQIPCFILYVYVCMCMCVSLPVLFYLQIYGNKFAFHYVSLHFFFFFFHFNPIIVFTYIHTKIHTYGTYSCRHKTIFFLKLLVAFWFVCIVLCVRSSQTLCDYRDIDFPSMAHSLCWAVNERDIFVPFVYRMK